MKKSLLKVSLIVFSLLSMFNNGYAQKVWTDHSRLLPDRLRGLPTVIEIYHDPSPVYPELNSDTAGYPGKYVWKHSTRVKSSRADLVVVAAGSYIWFPVKGWIPNIELNREGFANRFDCKDGILKKEVTYSFIKNYRFGDNIYAGDALWFVLAKDRNGKLYKGMALVETEGRVKK